MLWRLPVLFAWSAPHVLLHSMASTDSLVCKSPLSVVALAVRCQARSQVLSLTQLLDEKSEQAPCLGSKLRKLMSVWMMWIIFTSDFPPSSHRLRNKLQLGGFEGASEGMVAL